MISIIGSGKVGSEIAFMCASSSLGDIVLVKRDEKQALGQALDMSNAIPPHSEMSISATSDCSKIAGSDVVVIAVSSGIHKQKRVDLMQNHVSIIRTISPYIAKYAPDAKILMITNPVDVLAYVIQKEGRLASKNVMGVSSGLDSGRFRYLLAKEFGANQSRISDAIVMGEHDDSMVPIFSRVKFDGKRVSGMLTDEQTQRITADVRNYWMWLRDLHWYSLFGIAKNAFDIIKSVVKNEAFDVPVSVLLDGQYGVSDVCMGVPITLDREGVRKIRQVKISDDELGLLCQSAARIRCNIDSLAG